MFKAIFSFDGRIRRMEYGLSYLVYMISTFVIQLMVGDGPTGTSAMFYLLYIPIVWIMLAQGAKRCHDRGASGWFQIIPFYILWMLFADSVPGENEYGPNPKGIGNYDDIGEIGSYLEQPTV